jgi:hypothetical protein
MRLLRKPEVLIIALLTLTVWPVVATSQEPKVSLASANGTGTLKIGQEEFKVHAVVIKLFEDGKAEISIVSDITVFVSGTWNRSEDAQNTIKLQITGAATGGGIDASGKLLLRDGGKSIDRLWLQGASKTSKRNIEVNFQAQ